MLRGRDPRIEKPVVQDGLCETELSGDCSDAGVEAHSSLASSLELLDAHFQSLVIPRPNDDTPYVRLNGRWVSLIPIRSGSSSSSGSGSDCCGTDCDRPCEKCECIGEVGRLVASARGAKNKRGWVGACTSAVLIIQSRENESKRERRAWVVLLRLPAFGCFGSIHTSISAPWRLNPQPSLLISY